MLRTKDPKRSIEFYSTVFGMTLFKQLDFADMKFSLFFLGFLPEGVDQLPNSQDDRTIFTFQGSGVLELTYNWPSSDGDDVATLTCNNSKCSNATGFGHIAISVPDVYGAAERMDSLGVKFLKRPNEGSMAGIAFVEDPDGYQIEVFQADLVLDVCKKFGAVSEGSVEA
jgi:lactoylglutathione lyase